ncbi:alpha/beta fold hydrolase [Amycolatopsis sp. H20-H5]|uniref:alpha/beta fold hydrolase n=1 Tax=Amycolatopsis sp. H20-H5 TaxID=3046309 RepID=UPI002DBCE881|nr:alpha/beta hydrolase [Amycolatopsis sp. H20-H5]MEC3978211.1 alpha/beta hydrolase [Amycolatopsis sp. H20-H5]
MLGEFTDLRARERYFAAYDAVLRKWPVPADELDVGTGFGPTRVRRCGAGSGPPIVLLSGGMGTSLSWYPHIADLAGRHRIYAVDSIGEPGRSTHTRPILTPEDCTDWLGEVVDAVLADSGHEKVHLAGVSRGGWLALNLAARSRGRLAGVVTFEASGFGVIGNSFIRWSLVEILRWLMPLPILRLISMGDATVRHTMRPLLFGGLKYRQHLPEQRLFTDDDLRSIDVPTRIVVAERSVIHNAREVAARVEPLNPHIRAEIVPATSHGLSLERPELVTARILELTQENHADIADSVVHGDAERLVEIDRLPDLT